MNVCCSCMPPVRAAHPELHGLLCPTSWSYIHTHKKHLYVLTIMNVCCSCMASYRAPALAQLLLQYPFPATIYYKHMTSFTHTDNYRCMRSLHGLMSTLVRSASQPSASTSWKYACSVCTWKAYYIYTHKPVCVLSLHDLVSTPICGGTFCTHGLPRCSKLLPICVCMYIHT